MHVNMPCINSCAVEKRNMCLIISMGNIDNDSAGVVEVVGGLTKQAGG